MTHFGPVLACGLGGIWVEALDDVQLLVPPLSEAEVRGAIGRLRGARVWAGARGRAVADVPAFVDVVLRFSELVGDLDGLVREIDVNPLMVFEAGRAPARSTA